MAIQIPKVVTHYHLADKAPFLNLSDLAEVELATIMQDLQQRRASSGLKRVFGSRYMQLRRLTEARFYELFRQAGGVPERGAPHYFVLGSSQWYRGLAPNTREVVLPLAHLPTEVTSFTYPDSFTAMAFGPQFGLPLEPRPYHEQVFRLINSGIVLSLKLGAGTAIRSLRGSGTFTSAPSPFSGARLGSPRRRRP